MPFIPNNIIIKPRKDTRHHTSSEMIMTDQTPTQPHNDDDIVEEASSLLGPGGGGGGVPARTKQHDVPTMMRAMIATRRVFCSGTLTVIYSGGRRNTRSGGTSEALLRRQNNQATKLYAPATDICFADTDNAGKYCWYYTDYLPYGNWKVDSPHGNNNCGPRCIYPISGWLG